jgi:hypothetical protein
MEVHLENRTTLDYANDIIMDRLEVDMKKYMSQANKERILAAAMETSVYPGLTLRNGEKPTLAPIKIDGVTENELRRKAMLAQLSPLEVLKILDDTVESLLDGVLSLDYFGLFDQSVALLRAVNESYSPEFQCSCH